MHPTTGPTRILHALLLAATFAACAKSPFEPDGEVEPPTTQPSRWAATYQTGTKFGGASGTWRAASDLEITADRRVLVGGRAIINPTVGESTVTWSMADGNDTNASVQLLIESTNTYFWGNAGVAGKLFQGWIQFRGEGKLDYRGLAR